MKNFSKWRYQLVGTNWCERDSSGLKLWGLVPIQVWKDLIICLQWLLSSFTHYRIFYNILGNLFQLNWLYFSSIWKKGILDHLVTSESKLNNHQTSLDKLQGQDEKFMDRAKTLCPWSFNYRGNNKLNLTYFFLIPLGSCLGFFLSVLFLLCTLYNQSWPLRLYFEVLLNWVNTSSIASFGPK